jgi:cell division protease FtsH
LRETEVLVDPKNVFKQSYILIVFWSVLLLAELFLSLGRPRRISYTEFKAEVAAGRVSDVAVSPKLVRGQIRPGAGEKAARPFEALRVDDPELLRDLQAHGVKVAGAEDSSFWSAVWPWLIPGFFLLFFLGRRLPFGGQERFLTVGQSKAKIYMEKDVKVRFADVAGVDEAKEELQEVIEFLRTPEKFRRLGGKIPKGILLVGPPGTGKTLLARAVAGEANVPFFTISGSEFVELFVGVGAARVRDLFNQAREKAPCIIFIDELDALGKVRGVGPMAHEEREQTLNQLLVELDGFDPRIGVILMAATNRPEILDPALLRAGRFDRHVLVDRPDKNGRLAILRVHVRDIPLESEEHLEVIAGMTAGMVGADMANIVNEAALLAVRRGKERVGPSELDEAVERIIAGLEKKNRILNPKEKERVATHECGHALVALALGGDQIKKISVIPRGISALGYTIQLPTEDRFLMTKSELENKLATLFGGRVAEELVYQELSTGAQDDLIKATDIARSMVRAYGMSRKLGHIGFDRPGSPQLLDVPAYAHAEYSEEILREIDSEVRWTLDEQYARATRILRSQLPTLRRASAALLARETLSGEDLAAIVEDVTHSIEASEVTGSPQGPEQPHPLAA